MTREECKDRVNEIFEDVFDDANLQITDSMTANDIEDWDSLTHLQLISEIESAYKIKFTMGEIQGFANIGELIDTVMKKIK